MSTSGPHVRRCRQPTRSGSSLAVRRRGRCERRALGARQDGRNSSRGRPPFECDRATAASADPLHGRPYLFVLGNTFWHKNRVFALRLLQWLVEREGWDGGLVLAGGDTGLGSSVVAEAGTPSHSTPSLRNSGGPTSGACPSRSCAALYRGAELVLFPSMYEGFGLDPGPRLPLTERPPCTPSARRCRSSFPKSAPFRRLTWTRQARASERALSEIRSARETDHH